VDREIKVVLPDDQVMVFENHEEAESVASSIRKTINQKLIRALRRKGGDEGHEDRVWPHQGRARPVPGNWAAR